MLIGFPPCTYLTVSANRHFVSNPERWKKRIEAVMFAWELWTSPIEMIAIENPIGALSTHIGKPSQIIQPYFFGDNYPKSTCLWLKNLPVLKHSKTDDLFTKKTHVEPEYLIYNSKKNKSGKSKYSKFGKLGKGKGKDRSITPIGLANAMADQWGINKISV